MKTLKTNPGARRLMESLRNMGYDCSTAIADLVDNSVAAQASEIRIDIVAKKGSLPSHIVIADNGKGMDRSDLHEAMRFGTHQEYSADDLGKYGLGLKTASLSQCRTLTVSSKAKSGRDTRPRRHFMRWDLDHVYKTDDWNLLEPSSDELKAWEREALEHDVAQEQGTVVLWEQLDEALPLLSSENVRAQEKFMAGLLEEVEGHLQMVFHRFMQGVITGRRKLNIYLCGELLRPWDPFCRDEKTRELDISKMPVVSIEPDGTKLQNTVTVTPYVLPREDEFSTPIAHKEASGPRNWNQQQGFYFYRNHRLLQAGGWSWLRSVDEHTKLLRIAVDFTSDLDRAFSINITKMRARIPASIRDQVESLVSGWAKTARIRYDGKSGGGHGKAGRYEAPSAKTEAGRVLVETGKVTIGPVIFTQSGTNTRALSVSKDGKTGQIDVAVPSNHDLAALFTLKGDPKSELKKLCLAMLGILEAVHEKKMLTKHIPISVLRRNIRRYL